MVDRVKIKRALISVSDKTGAVDLARALIDRGIALLSTGGTFKLLTDAGLNVQEVSDYTGFPEMMGGRLKTLHPMVHGGLLALRDDPGHLAAMEQHAIRPIDLLVVNLYPFEETLAKGGNLHDCIENIDIGGPAMIRAAAKNHGHVTVMTDAAQYDDLLAEIAQHDGSTSLAFRQRLAGLAYARTASYDAAIAQWFAASGQLGKQDKMLPPRLTLSGIRSQTLRYGENPHQQAALYLSNEKRPGIATAKQMQGKELSFNNINDTDAAFELVAEFDRPAVAIIKHANPCGVAEGENLLDAYHAALRCDPVSAFGGIIAVNRPLDVETARVITTLFAEVVIAPSIDPDALAVFQGKKNLRILTTGGLPDPLADGLNIRSIAGGFLVQGRDAARIRLADLKIVTKREPTQKELTDLLFAFRVCKHVKSNAIVYAKNTTTVGIGAGQMSRVDSARIAAWKAEEAAKEAGLADSIAVGSVVASDAFSPLPMACWPPPPPAPPP